MGGRYALDSILDDDDVGQVEEFIERRRQLSCQPPFDALDVSDAPCFVFAASPGANAQRRTQIKSKARKGPPGHTRMLKVVTPSECSAYERSCAVLP